MQEYGQFARSEAPVMGHPASVSCLKTALISEVPVEGNDLARTIDPNG